MPDLTTLTARVLAFYAANSLADAVDLLYDEVDDTLIAGHIDIVAAWLIETSTSELPLVLLLCALTITNRWHPTLEEGRRRIADRVRQLDPARADDLLRGFMRGERVDG